MSAASLRIAWLSPFSERSDISAFSRCLLPHMADDAGGIGADCHLFVNDSGSCYRSPLPTMKLPSDTSVAEILATYDAAIFNMGNNVENHGGILEALRGMPGVAILHDFAYHHLFAHRCFDELKSPAAYARLMADWYGTQGFNLAIRSGAATHGSRLYSPWDSDHIAGYPLLEPIAGLAAAVVVHSRFMEERVRKHFHGPVLRLFLPSDQKSAPSPESMARWREETQRKTGCQFVTFGYLGRSKCIDLIVGAFAESPWLRSHAKLLICGRPGDAGYVQEVEELVGSLGLHKQVSFEYSATDERLLAIKEEADVFVNLRYPNTEGASGSLIEMLNAGKPVIVFRAGCYAEASEGVVAIEQADGMQALVDAMEQLGRDPKRRIELGAAGQSAVRAQDSRQYARELKAFIADTQNVLRRRGRYVAPIREARASHQAEANEQDTAWLRSLARSRLSFLLLDRDRDLLSPDAFLSWPNADIVALAARVLLNVKKPAEVIPDLTAILQRGGRWSFYQLLSQLRGFQRVCQEENIAAERLMPYVGRVANVDFWRIAVHLPSRVVAKIHYLAILGRRWGINEPDEWEAKLQSGVPACSLILDFLGSAEYRRFFSDDLMQDVGEWARDQLAIANIVPGGEAAPVLQTGIRLNFGEASTDQLLAMTDGWYPREEVGRWSNGRIGKLRFKLPGDLPSETAALELRLRVCGTAMTGARAVIAYGNGNKLDGMHLEDDSYKTWIVPLAGAAAASRTIDLLLIAKQAFSPARAGMSADNRDLGLLLSEACLVARDTPAIGAAGGDAEAEEEGETSRRAVS